MPGAELKHFRPLSEIASLVHGDRRLADGTMVRALMSSDPAAVLRIIRRQSDRAARPSPCSFSTPLPCARGPRDPDPLRPARALSPCLNDDPRRIPCNLRRIRQARLPAELRATTPRKPGFIADAKLGAVTPDRRGIITGGPPALYGPIEKTVRFRAGICLRQTRR